MAVLEYHSARRRYVDQYTARALEIAEAGGRPATSVRTQANAAFLAMIGSDLEAAVAGAERIVALATEAGMDEYVTARADVQGDGRQPRRGPGRPGPGAGAGGPRPVTGAGTSSHRAAFDVTRSPTSSRATSGASRASSTRASLTPPLATCPSPGSGCSRPARRCTSSSAAGTRRSRTRESVVTGDLLPGCLHPDLVLAAVGVATWGDRGRRAARRAHVGDRARARGAHAAAAGRHPAGRGDVDDGSARTPG